MNAKEEEILDRAIAAFRQQTNLPMEKIATEVRPVEGDRPGNQRVIDAVVQIDVPPQMIELWVEVKPALDRIVMAQAAHTFAPDTRRWLLATRHVHPKLADALHALHVQFIDAAGNAFIEGPPFFIRIQGNKREEPGITEGTDEDLFGRAGLKLIFAFLCRRDLLNATYRELAKAARVALGTVAGVAADLFARGYMVQYAGQERKLIRRGELLRKWVAAYGEKLRPKTLIGKFKAGKPEFWRQENIGQFDAQWGGEIAAYHLTHYNKPEVTTIYARKPVNDVTLGLKLRQDKNGDVELRERFWDFDMFEPDKTMVPPLLTYADLIVTGDPRNIETAKQIYDDYLQRYIEED